MEFEIVWLPVAVLGWLGFSYLYWLVCGVRRHSRNSQGKNKTTRQLKEEKQ